MVCANHAPGAPLTLRVLARGRREPVQSMKRICPAQCAPSTTYFPMPNCDAGATHLNMPPTVFRFAWTVPATLGQSGIGLK